MAPYEAPVPLSIQDATAPWRPWCVSFRIYAPEQSDKPLQAMVYFHCGGFFMGSVDMFDMCFAGMAAEGHLIMLAVSY